MATVTALDALNVARAAWERSQPQLIIDLWDDALEEVESSALPTGAAAAGSISSSASLTAVPHASPNSRHDALDLGAASQRLDTPWGAPFGNGGVREAAP